MPGNGFLKVGYLFLDSSDQGFELADYNTHLIDTVLRCMQLI